MRKRACAPQKCTGSQQTITKEEEHGDLFFADIKSNMCSVCKQKEDMEKRMCCIVATPSSPRLARKQRTHKQTEEEEQERRRKKKAERKKNSKSKLYRQGKMNVSGLRVPWSQLPRAARPAPQARRASFPFSFFQTFFFFEFAAKDWNLDLSGGWREKRMKWGNPAAYEHQAVDAKLC